MPGLWNKDISTLRKYYPWKIVKYFTVDGTSLSLPKDFTSPESENFERIVFLETNWKGKPYIVAYWIVAKIQDKALKVIQSAPIISPAEIADPSEWWLGHPRHQKLRRA